jgi:mycofactocin precursor peptide peptidase
MTELGAAVWPEIAEGGVLAVPLGSTEQHGPHLPFSTDTDIATALALRLGEAVPGVVVAPALAYGSSGEHQAFPGTLSIGQSAVELLVVELTRSAASSFARVVLISAHGGNEPPVTRAVRQLRAEGHDIRAWSPARVWSGDAHAGRIETSVMLTLHPDSVRLDQAEPGDTRPLRNVLPTLQSDGVRAVSENGILGDPTGASAEEGQKLLEAATTELATAVREWPNREGAWL